MPRKLINVSVLLLVVVLLAAPTISCRSQEPEAAPSPPISGADQAFLIEVTKPDDARQLEWASVSVWVTCTAAIPGVRIEVCDSTVGVSFPDLSDVKNVEFLETSLERHKLYAPGQKVYTHYGEGTEKAAEYPVLEAYKSGWEIGKKKKLSFRVRPEKAGRFTFYVKAYASVYSLDSPMWGLACEPTSGTKDQQGEYVQVHSFYVDRPIIG